MWFLSPSLARGEHTPSLLNPKLISFQGRLLRSRMLQLTIALPLCKQWPRIFNLPCCVGSSRDNSLKFKTWEFPQPGTYSTTITPAPKGGGEKHPRHPTGHAATPGNPTNTAFLQPAKIEAIKGGADGLLQPLNP